MFFRKKTFSITVILWLSAVALQCLLAKQPNIVVVFTDDHGWADLGVHGVVDDIKTPHLDAMAASGLRFNSGYITAPQCIPSRAGILSGAYQQSFGVDDNRYSPMPEEVLTVPERLQKAGYVTGMVGKWHLDPNVASEEWLTVNTYSGRTMPPQNERSIPIQDLIPFRPGNQGFDDYFCGYIHDYWANYDLDGQDLNSAGQHLKTEARDRLDIQSDAALAFIERNKEAPFFLYLAYFAPHVPLESSDKYLSRFPGDMPERRRYALAMISAVDEGVGRIREQLRQEGLLEDTLIFFIGDNGAPLKITMEDIPLSFKGGAWDGSMNTPLNGEKGMLSEGGVRVPFLMSWPDKIEPNQISDVPVSSLDVGATAVELAGLEKDQALHGENIFELLKDKRLASERPIYWRFWNQAAVRVDDWKYLRAGSHEFLFDLKTDKEETHNLIAAHPARAAELRALWEDWSSDLARPFEALGGQMNDQEQKWYAHYFKVGVQSAKVKELGNQPSWEVRHAKASKDSNGLRLSEFQKNIPQGAFITVNRLEIGLEAMLRVELTAAETGVGKVQIRYRGEPRFQQGSEAAFDFEAGDQTLRVALPIVPGQTLEHLRLFFPYQDQDIAIRSIDIYSDGSVVNRWDF